MNIRKDDVIHELIFRSRTAERLAWLFDVPEETVRSIIMDLFGEGLIAPSTGFEGPCAPGDVRCTNCHAEYEREYELPRPPCHSCGGFMEDTCRWRYVGGPISEALAQVA